MLALATLIRNLLWLLSIPLPFLALPLVDDRPHQHLFSERKSST
jgi:hypothetical protein